MARTQYRQPAAGAAYFLTYKRVKNINLRVGPDGEAHASAPCGVPPARVDAFVLSKAACWERRKPGQARRARKRPPLCRDARAGAGPVRDGERAGIPAFFGRAGRGAPALKVRRMKTRWGVCVPGKRQITLNLRLAEKPMAAVEYVMVHEYAHFVHCDHSPAFWAVVARILPDYKARRALLRA